MGALGRALGGLLAGYGQGLATQAKFDMEAAQKREEDDALMRRTLALEAVKDKNARSLASYTADRKDLSTAREIGWRADAEKETTGYKSALDTERELRVKKADFDYKVKELNIQLSNSQKLEAFKATQDIAKWNATTGAQNPIVRTIVSEDGQLYGVTKDGQSKPLAQGVKFPKAQGLDGLLMGLNGGGGEDDGGASPAASPAPAATPAQGGSTYTKAEYDDGLAKFAAARTKELQASGKPVNSTAIKQEWDQRLRSLGLRLTTGG